MQTDAFAVELKDKTKQQQFTTIAQQHIMRNLQDFSLSLSLPAMYRYAVKANKIWGGGIVTNMRRFWLNNKRVNTA